MTIEEVQIFEALFKDIKGCDLKIMIRPHCPKISSRYVGLKILTTAHRQNMASKLTLLSEK